MSELFKNIVKLPPPHTARSYSELTPVYTADEVAKTVSSFEVELAKANERVKKLEHRCEMLKRVEKTFSEAPDLTFSEVQEMFSDELNKFALEQKIEALDDLLEEIQCSVVVPKRYEQLQEPYLEGIKHCIQFIECQSEQLRKGGE